MRFPKPSFSPWSVGSTATLLLRLKSCGTRSRPTRSAIKALSLGLCDLIGTADALAPVLDELSEPVRLMVETEDDDKEFEREDRRAWCCVRAEAGDTLLPPLLGTETEVDGPCIIMLQFLAAETALCRRRLCARSTLCRLMRQQLTANHFLCASARSDAPEPFNAAWAKYDGRQPTCLIANAVGQWDSGYVMRPSVRCSRSRETESERLSICVPPCCPIQSPFIEISCPLYWSLPNATFHLEAH